MRINQLARRHVESYGAFHRATVNRWLHYVGIPLLVIALLGFASRFVLIANSAAPWLRLDMAVLFLAINFVWYFSLDRVMGLWTLTLGSVCYFVGQVTPLWLLVAFFVAGVVVHIIGHRICEKNSPAFFTNLRSILVAPLWLLDRWFGSSTVKAG